MNLEDLKKKTEIYQQDNTLNDNIKNIRISIINTAIQRIEGYQLYSKTLYQFLEESGELVNLTEQLYQIEDTLELNRISLKGLILESNLCNALDSSGIEYSLNDLKKYLYQNVNNPEIDSEVIGKEITLYETIEEIINYEKNQIDNMANIIGNLINDKELLERIDNKEKLITNKKLIIEKNNSLLKEMILDDYTKNILDNMIEQIFNNYMQVENKLPV